METDLQLAQRAALTGATVALPYFAALADLPRELKADGSVVTAADRAVESAIRDVLTAARPGDAILGEEEGQTAGTGTRRWIVDPIDGTALFVAGDDRWLILIALEEDGEIVAGVAAHPAQGSVFWATRGGGAYEGRVVGGRVVAATGIHAATAGAPDPLAAPRPATSVAGAPADIAPAVSASTSSMPADTAPADTAPADTAPADTAPADTAPADTAQADTAAIGSGPSTPAAGSAGLTSGVRGPGAPVGAVPAGPGPAADVDALRDARLGVVPEDWGQQVVAPLKALTPARPWTVHPGLLVARGELDIAVQTGGQIWDFAATSLIVTEAGGSYSGLNGRLRPGPGASVYARDESLRRAALDVLAATGVSA